MVSVRETLFLHAYHAFDVQVYANGGLLDNTLYRPEINGGP